MPLRPVEEVKKRDNMKMKLAKEKGMTLIIVPCWWDGRLERFVPFQSPYHIF